MRALDRWRAFGARPPSARSVGHHFAWLRDVAGVPFVSGETHGAVAGRPGLRPQRLSCDARPRTFYASGRRNYRPLRRTPNSGSKRSLTGTVAAAGGVAMRAASRLVAAWWLALSHLTSHKATHSTVRLAELREARHGEGLDDVRRHLRARELGRRQSREFHSGHVALQNLQIFPRACPTFPRRLLVGRLATPPQLQLIQAGCIGPGILLAASGMGVRGWGSAGWDLSAHAISSSPGASSAAVRSWRALESSPDFTFLQACSHFYSAREQPIA